MISPLLKSQLYLVWRQRRGRYAIVIFATLCFLALLADVLVSHRAVLVKYNGGWYFPSYGAIIPGKTFGEDYEYEVEYRKLQAKWKESGEQGNFIVMPFIPYSPYETVVNEGEYPPTAPSVKDRHFLGTDVVGRDIVARMLYGLRVLLKFSFFIVVLEYIVGIVIGLLLGYFGGKIDLIGQRLIEIWSNVPFLYVVIIVSSILVANFWTLAGIIVVFDWVNMTAYMRTHAYAEKAKDYVIAAQSLGMTPMRIMIKHILPNGIGIIVTFLPFSLAGAISTLSTLDFLGFGLPPPTPSWGELLNQGIGNLQAPWMAVSVVVAMVGLLTLITCIGEAVRDVFDPRSRIRNI